MVAVQSISLQWHMSLKCGNNENMYSHMFLTKILWNQRFYYLVTKELISRNFWCEYFSFFHTVWSHHSWFQVLSNCNPFVRYRLQVVSYYCFGYGSQKMKANASPYIRRTRGLLLSNAALSLWKYVEAATRSDAHCQKRGRRGCKMSKVIW